VRGLHLVGLFRGGAQAIELIRGRGCWATGLKEHFSATADTFTDSLTPCSDVGKQTAMSKIKM